MNLYRSFLMTTLLMALVISHYFPAAAQTPTTDPGGSKIFLPLVIGGDEEGGEPAETWVANQFIVTLQEDIVTNASVTDIAGTLATAYGVTVVATYEEALPGFTISVPSSAISTTLAALHADERIAEVEQDQMITVIPIEEPETEPGSTEVTAGNMDATQTNAPWGLDRIDQRNFPLNGRYTYRNVGTGVRVYIIDSGIRATHTEFEGRVSDGYDSIDGALPADDCFGHGTHVAATVGGKTYGVAKDVQLVSVRVLDCNGQATVSEVIAGVNWVTRERRRNQGIPMVANMSLGGPVSNALDRAVRRSIAAGVPYVIAAGNNYGANACKLSPARVPTAITVGATTVFLDLRALYSNRGRCLDLFAPGSSIPSAWFTSDHAWTTLSGTSMAAPHVAGAAALYLQENPQATPSMVVDAILADATPDMVLLAGSGSPNRLLFVPSSP